jgi:L-threonylcarbamoyladenylate synthase
MAQVLSVSLDRPEDDPLLSAAGVIKAGGVVVYPTETLYGIGADALNAQAIEKVHSVKSRTDRKPILIIVHTAGALNGLVEEVPVFARQLMNAFWPGPLTLVFRAGANIPHNLSRGSRTIGIRIPSSPLCLRLLELCGCPLTSTSANISGGPVLRDMSEIRKVLRTGVDMYLDAGILPERRPSTVVDVTGSSPALVRDGAIPFERIQEVTSHITR